MTNLTLILQILFVVKIDNRLNYVSLTSSVKQAYKRKQERDSTTRGFTKMDLVTVGG